MRRLKPVLLVSLLTLAANLFTVQAQTANLAADIADRASPVTVTFTFPLPADNYSLYQDQENRQRYYLRFATSNLPSYKIAPATSAIRPIVDNEKSDQDSLVFWITVHPNTAPRVDRNQSTLTLTFSPPLTSTSPLASQPSSVSQPALPAIAPPLATALTAAPLASAVTAAPPAPPVANVAGDNIATANVDLSVPESPAFTVLGLTPETVVRPNSPRQFASTLLSGVDQNGNFQSGTALDTVPYLLLAGDQLTLRRYNESYKLRLAARTQFSFATTKGASEDDKSVRLSLGLRVTLWDKGDPRTDSILMNCFNQVSSTYLTSIGQPSILPPDQIPPPPAGATPAEIDAYLNSKIEATKVWADYAVSEAKANPIRNEGNEACRAAARKRNWNKSSWMIAYAPSWISTTGETKNFKWNGGGFWTSVAYGFEGFPKLEERSQIILHARYRTNEQVPDPETEGAFFNQDSLFLGARLRVGSEKATGSFEGVFLRSRPEGKSFDTSARYSVGIERRIAENLWFSLAFGGESGRANGANKGFVLTSFKWGFSEKRNPSTN
jgi:hypothetical protein